jgi:8-oxo-dGTP diphosphatase
MVVHTEHDVGYLPLPNTVEVILSDELCDPLLTRTAFMLCVENGCLVLAQNQRRGLEVAGGHVEPGETLMEAAMREAYEEVGCTVDLVRPIGFLRMTSAGDVPEDWAYPHPLSYQQFFAGRVVERHPYESNEECAAPVRVRNPDQIERVSARLFGKHALSLF